MQAFTGATYLSDKFVDNDSGQACQHGNTQQMKKHRVTLSGDFSFQECDCFNVAECGAGTRPGMHDSYFLFVVVGRLAMTLDGGYGAPKLLSSRHTRLTMFVTCISGCHKAVILGIYTALHSPHLC